MTYAQVIRYFGTQTQLATALGITQSAVSAWGKVVPPGYQYKIEVITGRKLLVDRSLRRPANGRRRAAAVGA